MPREKDTRDFSAITRSPLDAANRLAALASQTLTGDHRVEVSRINPLTGTARQINVENAPPTSGSLVQRASDYLNRDAKGAFGYVSNNQPEFVPDAYVQRTTGNRAIVYLQQKYRGIPFFLMNQNVQFENSTTLDKATGDSTPIETELDSAPKIDAATAVGIAASYLSHTEDEKVDHWGQKLTIGPLQVASDYRPQTLSKFDSPSQPTTVARGPFGEEVKAVLNFFNQGRAIRLVWNMTVTMPERIAQYIILIAADRLLTGDQPSDELVLYCSPNMIPSHAIVTGNVFRHNPGLAQRQLVSFPISPTTYPLTGGTLPTPFPPGWWVEKDETVGNCTVAVKGNSTTTFKGSMNGDGLAFDPLQDQGDEQKMLNIFYFCNFMHDFLYMLGFDENAGNFQSIDFTGLGTGNDPVHAHAHPGIVNGTANMLTPPDGQAPTMNMGLVAGTNRHTAFDSDVVFHEYCHGLSNRLVGGRINSQALVEPQSRGMGEGWSDYFALTIQNHGRSPEKTVTGDWVTGRPAGIRRAPYDENYPNTFGDLANLSDEHDVGEIWCAALMQMNRELGHVLRDKDKGHELGWQIVVDGMKQLSANPSFLDARDAILSALQDLEKAGKLQTLTFTEARRAIWNSFARFGMGAQAQTNGPFFTGVTGDSSLPSGI